MWIMGSNSKFGPTMRPLLWIVTLMTMIYGLIALLFGLNKYRSHVKRYIHSLPFAYPAEYLILSSVLLHRWFAGMMLKSFGAEYEDTVRILPKPNTYVPRQYRVPYKEAKKKSALRNKSSTLLKLALLTAINVVTHTPRLSVSADKVFRCQMRKYRGSEGYLKSDRMPTHLLP